MSEPRGQYVYPEPEPTRAEDMGTINALHREIREAAVRSLLAAPVKVETAHYDTSDGFTTLTLCGISLFPKPGEIGPLLTADPALVTCPGCLARL